MVSGKLLKNMTCGKPKKRKGSIENKWREEDMSVFARVPSAVPPFLKVMVFVDGGYLREGYKKLIGHENIHFDGLVQGVTWKFKIFEDKGEVTRVYYYDAIVDASDDLQKHKQQKKFFHGIGLIKGFEVKLGRLVKTGSGDYRQKGVDISIAIDMLTKAFQNFYDVAIFIGGDDDFVDLINTVKNLTNKKVYGVAFQHNVSQRLLESFDNSYILTKEDCDNWTLVKP